MKNIYSNIKRINKKSIFNTVNYLKKNNIVGLPTETVYGIAGNAYSKKALKSIYKLKKRPKKNPLIIHYFSINDIKNDVEINFVFQKLYKKFCPGPITFVLKKKRKSKIHKLATANLDTVAIRFPAHKQTRKILRKLKFPLAMPSANISSGLSPVSALDVHKEFKNKVKIILNGGKSKIGIESTVIDLSNKIKILRPGILTKNDIKFFLKKNIAFSKSDKIKAPGNIRKHYSPGIPIKLNSKRSYGNHAFITFGKKFRKGKHIFNLSEKSDLKEIARNLYKTLRKIKELRYRKIYIVKIPNKGIGIAINDRLKRASKYK